MLRPYEFASANIRLLESYGVGLPCVVVNPEEIQQVILNLILNAEQAMRAAHRGANHRFVSDSLPPEVNTVDAAAIIALTSHT